MEREKSITDVHVLPEKMKDAVSLEQEQMERTREKISKSLLQEQETPFHEQVADFDELAKTILDGLSFLECPEALKALKDEIPSLIRFYRNGSKVERLERGLQFILSLLEMFEPQLKKIPDPASQKKVFTEIVTNIVTKVEKSGNRNFQTAEWIIGSAKEELRVAVENILHPPQAPAEFAPPRPLTPKELTIKELVVRISQLRGKIKVYEAASNETKRLEFQKRLDETQKKLDDLQG